MPELGPPFPQDDEDIIGDSVFIPRLHASDRPIIPSLYDRKDRLRDDPDLVFQVQLLNYLLGEAMERLGVYTLAMDSVSVAKNRMRRVEVTETECGGIRAVRES